MIQHNQPFRLTKIIATLGPASEDLKIIVRLIEEGVSVFRINFSHGTFEDYARLIHSVRRAAEQTGLPTAVMGDLAGPKIRVGEVVPGGVHLQHPDTVIFQKESIVTGTPGTIASGQVVLSTTYPGFIDEVKPNQPVLLDDGHVLLKCIERSGSPGSPKLVCEVIHGGVITSRKGINLPDTDLSVPALTERDLQCVTFAVEHGFDFLALSFVRQPKDVRQLKDLLHTLGARDERSLPWHAKDYRFTMSDTPPQKCIPIIAKIEKPQAVADLEAIIEETDGVMVARGDLGVEMDLAKVPILQKRIVSLCHDYGKPVIVATQMLQSMINSPAPTRAEVSDVGNAIFDGADAVMLSGETAVGQWPVEAVTMMTRIESLTNEYVQTQSVTATPPRKYRTSKYRTAALAHGVSVIIRDVDAKLVTLWTKWGGGPNFLSQNRLPRPIVAFSSTPAALRNMTILYGLTPVFMEQPTSTGEFVMKADQILLEHGWVNKGDPIVVVLGEPIRKSGLTNSLRIHYVGDEVEDTE